MIKLNSAGIFKGKEPLMIPEKIMTCVALSNIRALISGDIDIYHETYSGVLPVEMFSEHVASNVRIVTLRDSVGKLYYYPEIFIHSTVRADTVVYVEKTIIIDVGAHKEIKTFHNATKRMLNVLREIEGVEGVARLITSSKPRTIKVEQHDEIIRLREQEKSSTNDPYRLLKERELYIATLESRIQNFITFFLEYLDRCTESEICCGEIIDDTPEPIVHPAPTTATEAYLKGCPDVENYPLDIPDPDVYYINTSR